MKKILISIFSAFIGFAISQSFNIVNYFRRPKFRTRHMMEGVLSSYAGDTPETPWEIELGFFLENYGRNPAKNTRIFVSDLKTANGNSDKLEWGSLEFSEIKRPIDVIPPGEVVMVRLGKIKSDTHSLKFEFQSEYHEEQNEFLDSDTREKTSFLIKFHIYCDDKNSATVLNLRFEPEKDDFASGLLEDYSSPIPTGPNIPSQRI